MLDKVIYINPSHQHSNIGVDGYGTEAENCYQIAVGVKELLDSHKMFKAVYVGKYNATLSETIKESNSVKANVHVEIHSDAGILTSRGCTGLYLSEEGRKLITEIYNRVSEITPTEDRGIRRRTDLGAFNQTNAYACLIEMMFHTSIEDVQFFMANKDKFIRAIAEGICAYYGVTLPEQKPVVEAPKPQAPQSNKFYMTTSDRKEFIKKLQTALNDSKLRDKNGRRLIVDGSAGSLTMSALQKVVLKYGSTGLFVRLVQARLGGLTVDGSFGTKTKARVIEFQKARGLSPDGSIGILTWTQLVQ